MEFFSANRFMLKYLSCHDFFILTSKEFDENYARSNRPRSELSALAFVHLHNIVIEV